MHRNVVHPLIDVSALFLPGHTQRARVTQHIRQALTQQGYFYAQNVPVLPTDYISSIYAYSKRLHLLPTHVKQRFSAGTYTGPDIGKRELDYEKGTVSAVRSWDFSRTRFTLGQGENKYPEADVISPPYAQVLNELYSKQDVLAVCLLTVFAEMFSLPSHTFTDMFKGEGSEGDFGTIRLLYYPGKADMSAEEAEKVNAGISPHTDFELFTLMHQDASGLQFLLPGSKEWLDTPVRPGEFVVTIGDILERFTNGELKATPHRVVVTPHPRYSIIRFNAVAAETVVKPLPQFLMGQPAQYSWVTMKTHMDTTMRNLNLGKGAWDPNTNTSTTASYLYVDGRDPNGEKSNE